MLIKSHTISPVNLSRTKTALATSKSASKLVTSKTYQEKTLSQSQFKNSFLNAAQSKNTASSSIALNESITKAETVPVIEANEDEVKFSVHVETKSTMFDSKNRYITQLTKSTKVD